MNAGDMVKRVAGQLAAGLHGSLRIGAQGHLGILLYHRVTDVPSGLPLPEFTVTPDRFRQQLAGLQKRGFTFVTLSRAIHLAENGEPWPRKPLVVTFDDGFENVYLHAWPTLRQLGIPATIFVTTAFLDSGVPFPFDPWGHEYGQQVSPETYRPLREQQCREMMAGGLVELGAHTHTHQDFRNRPDALYEDLQECVRSLEQRFGIRRPPFTFPFGRVALGFAGNELTQAARRAGVAVALTTECVLNRPGSDPFDWGRFNVYDWDTSRTLAAKVSGWYGWAPKLQDWLASWKPTRRRRCGASRDCQSPSLHEAEGQVNAYELDPPCVSVDEARIDPTSRGDAFNVSDRPWFERLEGIALRSVSTLGIGLNAVLGRRVGSCPGIITYHRVARHDPGHPAPLHNVTPEVFRSQLEGLLSRGFAAWPLDRLLDHARRRQSVPPKMFVVTFDDGFETVYTQAWPILKELDIPATLFVSTAYIDQQDPFPFDEWGVRYHNESPAEAYRPLTLDQLREMQASGWIQLGAHTHTHEDFRDRAVELTADIRESVHYLQTHFGLTAVPFAFPFGSSRRGFSGAELVIAAKRAGVTCGLTTDPMSVDLASDVFTWGRFNAFAWDTSASLAAKLDGWYSWASRLKRYLESTVSRIRVRA